MNVSTLRIAMGQMLVQGGAVDQNLARAQAMIYEAAERGCQVIVLPECLDAGWTHPRAREMAKPIPGAVTERLGRIAAETRLIVVAGLTELAGDRVYNSAVLIDRDGRLGLKHRKINVMDIAQDLYAIGDRLGVADTDVGRLGVNICADNFPNTLDIGSVLGRMGARLLLSPSAWAVDADHDNVARPYGELWRNSYGRLAKQFNMPVVGVSNVGPLTAGPWAGRKCIGCSLAVDATGKPVMMGPYNEAALVVAEVPLGDNPRKGTEISGTL